MRKIYRCLTWAILAVALSACSNNQQAAEPANGNKAAIETPAVQEAPPTVQEAAPPADQAPPAATPHN